MYTTGQTGETGQTYTWYFGTRPYRSDRIHGVCTILGTVAWLDSLGALTSVGLVNTTKCFYSAADRAGIHVIHIEVFGGPRGRLMLVVYTRRVKKRKDESLKC